MASVDVPVALLGYGTVGAAVNRLLNEQADDIERATGHRLRVVKALVPLSEMFGYVGDLRSKTSGRASYSMQFDSYAEVPKNVAEEIVAKAKGE